MRIPTRMVAMEPERKRQWPETERRGDSRLKGQAPFRGVGTRDHVSFPLESSQHGGIFSFKKRNSQGQALVPQQGLKSTALNLFLITALLRYNFHVTKFPLLRSRIHWFLEWSQLHNHHQCLTSGHFHHPQKKHPIH